MTSHQTPGIRIAAVTLIAILALPAEAASVLCYSNVFVTTTVGSTRAGDIYEFQNPDLLRRPDGLTLVAIADPQVGAAAFNINFSRPLTNAGGSIDLATGDPPFAFESNAACFYQLAEPDFQRILICAAMFDHFGYRQPVMFPQERRHCQ